MRKSRIVASAVSVILTATGLAVVPFVAVAQAASIGSLANAGERAGATRLSFPAGDRVQAQVDVGTGNLLVSVAGLSIPGIEGATALGAFYNSAASQGSSVPRLGRGWGLDYTPDIRVVPNSDSSATVHLPGGLAGVFPSTSATAYSSPAGFKMTLVKTSSGWRLTEHDSQTRLDFGSGGALTGVVDRNNNAVTVSTSGSGVYPTVAVRSPAGATNARAANITTSSTSSNAITTLFQGASTSLREIKFEKVNDDATRFTDARGRVTTFAYANGGLLTEISAPGGVTTRFTYDSQRRVGSITQVDQSASGPGDSVTRLTYPTTTTTLLAQPNTDQGQPVSAVPRTTFTLDATQRVTKIVDEMGRQQSASYTPNFDTATASLGSGAGTSTLTNTWGGNSGQSRSASESPTGSTQTLTYGTSSGPGQYGATGATDDAGNASTFGYDGAGNQLTRTDSSSATAKLALNADGTVASATSPANGTNATGYRYTNKQVTSMTPVSGSSLGARDYSYDSFGRLSTATNGRGITTTYGYNLNDQVTSISYTGGLVITYEYDEAGRNNRRSENSGTTTYDYDALGRLLGRQNSAHGGSVRYTYDRSSNLKTSESQSSGLVKYNYDASNEATSVEYPSSSPSAIDRLRFTTDDQGRRTGTYLQANEDLSAFAGRSQTTYDQSGRVARITADLGPSNSNNTRIVDLTYCYFAQSTPSGGCSGARSADRDKLAWEKDNLSGKETVYSYDSSGRLVQAAVTGGDAPTTYSYSYDANGNRVSANGRNATFNPASQITSAGYAYDGAGNQTADPASGSSAISYSPLDQVSSVTKDGQTYAYEHAGTDNAELLRQTSPDGTYRYTYGRDAQSGVPIVEQIDRTNVNNQTARAIIISDPITGQPLMLRSSAGTNAMYVQNGSIGAPIALITTGAQQAFGYNYDPYGVPVITQNSGGNGVPQNPYTFGGNGVRDRTTGWVRYGARYYSPQAGVFTQQDTLDAPLSPLDANRYAFAGGDPVNNVDPTGDAAFLAPLALQGVRFAASRFGPAAARTVVRGVGSVGRGALNSSVNRASTSQARSMNVGEVRLGASTRAGSQVRENAFRVRNWHYYLTGSRY